MRPSLAVLGTVLWLPPCLGCPPEAPPPPEPVDATPDDAPWPHDPGAVWPVGCFVEVTASHPSQPWLALACTNAEANMGAVLVVDLDSGTLRSSTLIEDYVGWPATDVLRWHPDGELLATNVGTNGIAVLANGEVLGMAFPDETRDHPVAFVWVGDHVFTDTGAYFRIEEGQEPRFEFDELPAVVPFRHYGFLPPERVMLLCTGSQGELRAGLSRIAANDHPHVYLEPGDTSLEEMIASTSDGWFLDGARNGQADATGEFMFGTVTARRIRAGRLGELVRGVTVTGNAFEVLRSVDAVSSEFRWDLGAGHCGKGQPAKVDAGGPYIRCTALLGGTQD